ncbi:transglycosylase [Lactococcus kimchii]|uniref:transglycosylase n=1 Tax=Lactococcus sp. S-13 TaxID=2507158 RepID=UPI001022FE9E|nr:transglycosylase [Lactococcus sp. S-13]RZI48893.1 transglycosylase [Lactococcus sp. S-13]
MKFSKVAISTGLVASFMFIGGGIAHADTPKASTHDVALEVINGNYGNGDIRTSKLKSAGYDAVAIQNEVNQILTGNSSSTPTGTSSTATEEQPTQAAPVNTGGLNMSQTSGQVDIQALANYMASSTANSAGYSASEWAYIITHESNGVVNSVNASSGAYGAFQLLGHGEYSGMPLSEQIAMASKLPAGSWVVYN